MIHNASEERYRNPLGSVSQGDEVTVRLLDLPEEATKVEVVVFSENHSERLAMKRLGSMGERVLKMPDQPCVVWYYFQISEGDHIYYYGARPGRTTGEGLSVGESPFSFQITVSLKEFDTPRWMSRGIMYQVFPDRFCRGNIKNTKRGARYHRKMGRDVFLHKQWEEQPIFGPLEGKEFYDPCDYFGGDLEGVIQHLDRLKSMGVTCIYMNPIVESASNHRYNTADYKKVDPFLGTNKDFKRLCDIAEKKGIHIILDGVFSHTGADSVYFNKNGNYENKGAFQGPESPYYSWYSFDENGEYKSWWGFNSLPEVNEMNPDYRKFIISGRNSVFHHWLGLGASGFRLDVADELPDEFIFEMRKYMKMQFKNYALIGEVWEDCTTKESYGVKRKYALGQGLDSVMNYPFKVNCVNYLLGYTNAYSMQEFLLGQQCNYPKPLYYALMNLLSSHDIPRIRTTLATGMNETLPSREKQIEYIITHDMDRKGRILERLAFIIQFFIPGMPSIYYGDEYGMQGLMDPLNRGPLFQRDLEVFEGLKGIGMFRRNERVMQTGYSLFFAVNEKVLGIVRFVTDGKDVFGERCKNGAYVLLVNPGCQMEKVRFDLRNKKEGVSEEQHQGLMKYLRDSVIHTTVDAYDFKVLRFKQSDK